MSFIYVKTDDGHEIDFFARSPTGASWLIQVASSTSDPTTRDREVRSLMEAGTNHPTATRLLITTDASRPTLPLGIEWQSASAWLLEK